VPRDIFAGAIASVVTIAYAVSFSALIFSSPLEQGLEFAFSALLIGAAVTGIVVGLFSVFVPADAGPDTPAVAVMGVLAASLAQKYAASVAPDSLIVHVLIAIGLATLLTGALLLALGTLRAGQWLRFIPYPVIGGFLAASGWLLISGGLEVATASPLIDFSSVQTMLSGFWPQAATAAGFAAVILGLRHRIPTYLLLPGTFLLGVLIINPALWLAAQAGLEVDHNAWFLETSGQWKIWWPPLELAGTAIRWDILWSAGAEIAAVCGVTAIALLLDISSLEIARGKSVDLDHELRVNGFANVVTSGLGGFTGNLSMVGSLLLGEAGALSRLSTLTSAAICTAAIFTGHLILNIVPMPLLCGVLIYLCVSILYDSLIESAGRRSAGDNLLAAAIAIAIVLFGYLTGILFGVIAACVLFVLSYARISIIKQHLSRANFSSNVDRSSEAMRALSRHGEKIQILWLRGYIFFGTSNRLYEYLRTSIWDNKDCDCRSIVIDFGQVPGFDSSAIFSLVKLRNACRDHAIALVLSGMTKTMRKFLENAGFFAQADADKLCAMAHRDDALEWCEDALLTDLGLGDAVDSAFSAWLTRELGGTVDAERVLSHLVRINVKAGQTVVRQGTASNSIDLIASGRVVISYQDAGGTNTRLRQMAGQTVVGEMGFYRRGKRTASVVAETATVVYRLRRKAFKAMQGQDPEAAAAFHSFIIRLLADRLEFANREIAALQ